MALEEIQAAGELLSTTKEPRSGSGESEEALIHIAKTRFPNKGFCIVQQWTIVRAIASDGDLTKIHVHGHLPLFVFAEKVILGSRGRFDYGNWVRSTMAISLQDGFSLPPKILCTFWWETATKSRPVSPGYCLFINDVSCNCGL